MRRLRAALSRVAGAKRVEWIVLAAIAAIAVLLWAGGAARESSGTDAEARLARVLSAVEGAGRVRVMLGDDTAGGAIVVCDGADDLSVRLRLAQAVQAMTGIENSRIEVLKMEGGG